MDEVVKKESLLLRIIKKLLKWLVMVVILIAFFIFYTHYRSQKKAEFFLKTWKETKALCNGDAECIETAKSSYKQCFKDNYYTQKRGRFNREDKIDQEGLLDCMGLTAEEPAGEGE